MTADCDIDVLTNDCDAICTQFLYSFPVVLSYVIATNCHCQNVKNDGAFAHAEYHAQFHTNH